MKTKLITMLIIGSGLMLGSLHAQQGGVDNRPGQQGPGMGANQRGIPEFVADQVQEMQDLREELRGSREALIASLGEDATPVERHEAMVAWREVNADKLARAEELRDEIRDAVQANRPDRDDIVRPVRPALPEEILEKRDTLRDLQNTLSTARAELVNELREANAGPEAIAQAMAAFREANADIISQIQQINRDLAAWAQENRPVRPDRPTDPAMHQRRADFAANAREMQAARQDLRESLRGAVTPEERREAIEAFRLNQRELMEQQKEIRRQQRLGGGEDLGGERRPGE